MDNCLKNNFYFKIRYKNFFDYRIISVKAYLILRNKLFN